MGAIMVWRTSVADVAAYETFGSYKADVVDSRSGVNTYLLDGVQRLTTLIDALAGQAVNEGEQDNQDLVESDGRRAYFDLEENDFVAILRQEFVSLKHLDLSLLLDSFELLKFQRLIVGEDAEIRVRRCDELAKAFNQYKIPIIPIVTDEVDLAAVTFKRINSAGKQMSELHMIHALTWSASFNLFDQFDEIRDGLNAVRWGGVDDDTLLRAAKAALELDIYRTPEEKFGKTIRANVGILEDIGQSLEKTAKFLDVDFGMPSPEFVPYSVQIVFLSEIFRALPHAELSSPWRQAIAAWLVLTSVFEVFAGMSGDRLNANLNSVRSYAQNNDIRGFVSDCIPLRGNLAEKYKFDFRTARSRILMSWMARTSSRESCLLKKYGRDAVQPLFPRGKVSVGLFNSIGNKVLVEPEHLEDVRAVVMGGSAAEDFMERHIVSHEILSCITSKDFDRFVVGRRKLLDLKERSIVVETIGRAHALHQAG